MVWPDRVRPLASVMVPEIMTGTRTPVAAKCASMAKMRRLGVERVEDRLDHEQVRPAFEQRLHRFSP